MLMNKSRLKQNQTGRNWLAGEISTAGVEGGFEASAKLALNNTIVRRQAYTFVNGV